MLQNTTSPHKFIIVQTVHEWVHFAPSKAIDGMKTN